MRFHLSTPESKTVLLLSMSIQCWPDLAKYGARESLEKMYEGYILPEAQTEAEYNVSLSIDLERLPTDESESRTRSGLPSIAISRSYAPLPLISNLAAWPSESLVPPACPLLPWTSMRCSPRCAAPPPRMLYRCGQD